MGEKGEMSAQSLIVGKGKRILKYMGSCKRTMAGLLALPSTFQGMPFTLKLPPCLRLPATMLWVYK